MRVVISVLPCVHHFQGSRLDLRSPKYIYLLHFSFLTCPHDFFGYILITGLQGEPTKTSTDLPAISPSVFLSFLHVDWPVMLTVASRPRTIFFLSLLILAWMLWRLLAPSLTFFLSFVSLWLSSLNIQQSGSTLFNLYICFLREDIFSKLFCFALLLILQLFVGKDTQISAGISAYIS